MTNATRAAVPPAVPYEGKWRLSCKYMTVCLWGLTGGFSADARANDTSPRLGVSGAGNRQLALTMTGELLTMSAEGWAKVADLPPAARKEKPPSHIEEVDGIKYTLINENNRLVITQIEARATKDGRVFLYERSKDGRLSLKTNQIPALARELKSLGRGETAVLMKENGEFVTATCSTDDRPDVRATKDGLEVRSGLTVEVDGVLMTGFRLSRFGKFSK